MSSRKVLFISGSGGLGHVVRDLPIVREMRRQEPVVEISWIAASPAREFLRIAGETLLPEADMWSADTDVAEKVSEGHRLNLMEYVRNVSPSWRQNWEVFKQIVQKYEFDIIVGDEPYGITGNLVEAVLNGKPIIDIPFVIIYDFVGLEAMTDDPQEIEMVDEGNQGWMNIDLSDIPAPSQKLITRLFVGEPEDVQNKESCQGLIKFRDLAEDRFLFIGNIVRFDPAEYADKAHVRAKLGYDANPLVVCAVGGTKVGKELLELCGQAYSVVREVIPDLRMVLVCGPRITPASLNVPPGLDVRGLIPALYEHFAACDLAIIQPGLSTATELAALRRPFLYFPLSEHFEQRDVSMRLERRRIGVKMIYDQTTPKSLAEQILKNIGKEVNYPPIDTKGAQRAAKIILDLVAG